MAEAGDSELATGRSSQVESGEINELAAARTSQTEESRQATRFRSEAEIHESEEEKRGPRFQSGAEIHESEEEKRGPRFQSGAEIHESEEEKRGPRFQSGAEMSEMEYEVEEEQVVERLPCNLSYVVICLLMPTLNGSLSGFMYPGYSLHWVDMGWSLEVSGLALGLGYMMRMICQQLLMRTGYWLIVPLGALHLTFAVLGLLFWDQEWAVFMELVVFIGVDLTCAIEGIGFDAFGSSESQARQAASTQLSVITISSALSCTVGGIVFDQAGWTGVAAYHSIVQGCSFLLVCVQPTVRNSFVEVWLTPKVAPEDGDAFQKVLPQEAKVKRESGAEDLLVEDMTAENVRLLGDGDFEWFARRLDITSVASELLWYLRWMEFSWSWSFDFRWDLHKCL